MKGDTKVINYLNIQEAQDAAKVTFEEFQKHADRARFFGSLFTGPPPLCFISYYLGQPQCGQYVAYPRNAPSNRIGD